MKKAGEAVKNVKLAQYTRETTGATVFWCSFMYNCFTIGNVIFENNHSKVTLFQSLSMQTHSRLFLLDLI